MPASALSPCENEPLKTISLQTNKSYSKIISLCVSCDQNNLIKIWPNFASRFMHNIPGKNQIKIDALDNAFIQLVYGMDRLTRCWAYEEWLAQIGNWNEKKKHKNSKE